MNVKEGITCMATITLGGNSLFPYFIKKGSTTKCLKSLNGVKGTFSPNGWMNEKTSIEYINDIIIPHLKDQKGCLIWDVYRAHMTDKVRYTHSMTLLTFLILTFFLSCLF